MLAFDEVIVGIAVAQLKPLKRSMMLYKQVCKKISGREGKMPGGEYRAKELFVGSKIFSTGGHTPQKILGYALSLGPVSADTHTAVT